MTNRSLAPASAQPNPLDRIADRIERELHRLRDQRPHLEERIDRAANILVTHLACPRSRTIRVRLHQDGSARFLVSGSGGNVYSVDPASWSCTCPDFEYRGTGCKHGLAAYVLRQAAKPVVRKRTCCGCDVRLPRRELVEVHEGDERYFPGDLLCKGCADSAGVEW